MAPTGTSAAAPGAGPVSYGPAPPDPLARTAAIGIALARIGIGVGALALTGPALKALGFEDPETPTVVLARMAGVRDVALGLHALSVRDDAERLREATILGAAVDAGDTFAFGAALAGRGGIDATALKNLPITAGAVAAGAWLAARLGR